MSKFFVKTAVAAVSVLSLSALANEQSPLDPGYYQGRVEAVKATAATDLRSVDLSNPLYPGFRKSTQDFVGTVAKSEGGIYVDSQNPLNPNFYVRQK
jgi:hypothetical protein